MRMEKNNGMRGLSARQGGLLFSAMMILYLIISVFGQAVIMLLRKENSVIGISISATFSSLAIVVATLLIKTNSNEKLFDACGVKKFNPLYILLALLFSLSMFFGLGFINGSIAELFSGWGIKVPSISFPLDNFGQFIIFSIVFALLPAIFEEVFFRGVILKSLDGAGVVASSLICALFFALYHCSVAQLVYQFIYGIGLCLLVKLSKSVVPAMISHFINNFGVILIQYLKLNVNLYDAIFIALGLVGLVAFSVICAMRLKNNEKEERKETIKNFLFPYGIVGGVACVLLAVTSLF